MAAGAQIRRNSTRNSGSREGEFSSSVGLGRCMAVRAADLAGMGTGAERLVDNALDGARTTAAFGTATKAAIKLLGATWKVVCGIHGVADVVVAQHIAGTDNH
jgi:hypothetical protein